MGIDWSVFDGKYFKPDTGKQYVLILSNWRVEDKIFDEQTNNVPKKVLAFQVQVINGNVISETKEWCTSSRSAINQFKPLIEVAERNGVARLRVILKRLDNKDYSIIEYPGV